MYVTPSDLGGVFSWMPTGCGCTLSGSGTTFSWSCSTNCTCCGSGADGRKVWECYVVGLDPEDTTNDFKIVSFQMGADGLPDITKIVFDPPQTKWNVQGAVPVLKGKATLESGEWQTVTDENKAQMRFFKVEVEIP